MTRPVRILVVEDDAALAEILYDELEGRGHEVQVAHTVAEGIDRLGQADFDVALLDLTLPDGSGIDVLRKIGSEELGTEGIVLTGHATVGTALEAMKLGAYDYVTKPARIEEIDVLVTKAAEKARLKRENESLRVRLERQDVVAPGLVTGDPGMRELLSVLDRVAPSEIPVLIQGESGTGKELLAHAIHKRSPRAAQPFVAVNCGAVPETLIESELFGHEKGAFTGAVNRKPGLFEIADRGVLFLDEIGEVSHAIQVRLLRVLETQEFLRVGATRPTRSDVRVVCASNKDLKSEMGAGRFRDDLYYRLNGVTLKLPALRERKGDVALLARHFVERFAPSKRLSPGAVLALESYPWPGNVRELQMVIQRAALLAHGETLEPADFPLEVRHVEAGGPEMDYSPDLSLAEVERRHIETVLQRHQGHRGRTARALGIDPKTLYNKLGPERTRTRKDAS